MSRVLRPGGVFVASTFVADIIPPAIPLLRIGRPVMALLLIMHTQWFSCDHNRSSNVKPQVFFSVMTPPSQSAGG